MRLDPNRLIRQLLRQGPIPAGSNRNQVRGEDLVHGNSLLFTGAPAHLRADSFPREISRGAMQPALQRSARAELPCLLRQRYKNILSYILRNICVTHHPQRRGINQINMPTDEFSKRSLGFLFRVFIKQALIGCFVHSQHSTRRRQNPTLTCRRNE